MSFDLRFDQGGRRHDDVAGAVDDGDIAHIVALWEIESWGTFGLWMSCHGDVVWG